jgi:hypothetical protein
MSKQEGPDDASTLPVLRVGNDGMRKGVRFAATLG